MTVKNFMPNEDAARRQLRRLTQLISRYGVPALGIASALKETPFEGYSIVNGFLKESKPQSVFAPGIPETALDAALEAMEEAHRQVGNYSDKIKNLTPDNWPAEAPPYASAEGWEYEKAAKLKQLRALAVISWYSRQGTARHSLIADRLREIL